MSSEWEQCVGDWADRCNELSQQNKALQQRTAELQREVERMQEESRQWEKVNLVALLRERDDIKRQLAIEQATAKLLLADLAEAAITWTTEKPTEPGTYFREYQDGEHTYNYIHELSQYDCDNIERLYPKGRWAGPIPLPKEPQ